MTKSADRSQEFNRLLEEQGHATRSMKYGWRPSDDERQVIDARATRLLELAELLSGLRSGGDAGAYVNDRLAAWLRANPLALTKRRVKQVINDSASNVDGQVAIQIGEPGNGGHFYQAFADDCTVVNGVLRFSVPDSVAEYFRQQGRRQLQRSIRHDLGI